MFARLTNSRPTRILNFRFDIRWVARWCRGYARYGVLFRSPRRDNFVAKVNLDDAAAQRGRSNRSFTASCIMIMMQSRARIRDRFDRVSDCPACPQSCQQAAPPRSVKSAGSRPSASASCQASGCMLRSMSFTASHAAGSSRIRPWLVRRSRYPKPATSRPDPKHLDLKPP